MKKFGNPLYHLAVCCLFSTVFFACQKQEASEEKETIEHAKHAVDWEPTDPILVSGKEIYVAECAICHDEGEEQSPRLGKLVDWAERNKQPIDIIINKAINGFIGEDGEMPAKGGSDYLTDEEVAAAVKFMVMTPIH